MDTGRPLRTSTKFFYGLGDWGTSAAATARNIFWFIFLTNVVGLGAGWAGTIVLIGKVWDAVNDPLVGTLSDRLHSRWGRRRPFLLFGSIPFAFTFFLMFLVPPTDNQAVLILYYSLVYLLFDTLFTVVNVPYLAMMPEMTGDYDERSSLTGWRIAMAMLAQLVTAGLFKLLAENVFAPLLGGGPEALRAGYMLSAALWAVTIAVPYLLVVAYIPDQGEQPVSTPVHPVKTFIEVFRNKPFRLAALIYLLCFATGDIILVIFARYLIDYAGVPPGTDNLILALVLAVGLVSVPLVVRLMRRYDKRTVYLISISFLTIVLLVMSLVPPGLQPALFVAVALTGFGFGAISVIPWAIVADVVEADELETGERREGLFAGYLVFLRKLGSAVAVFTVGQVLEASGFISSTSGSEFIAQPQSALNAMRFLVTVVPAAALALSLVLAWRFPIDRETYEEIRRQLAARRSGLSKPAEPPPAGQTLDKELTASL